MAISVNQSTWVITIPKADTTFESTDPVTSYEIRTYDEYDFMRELADWMDNEAGIPAPNAFNHNTESTLAGVTYSRQFELLSPYTIQFGTGTYQVKLNGGTNNNLVDKLRPNGVSLIPANSAGKQTVSSGSGLDTDQNTKLNRIHALLDTIEGTLDHQEVMRLLLAAAANKLSGADGTSVTIRDLADTKNRISATVDQYGNRTAVTVDAS